MAFVQINKSAQGNPISNEIRMGSRLQSKTVPTRSIYFSISYDVAKRVGWEISSSTDSRTIIRMAVNEGTDEDAGFLLLSEDQQKGYILGASHIKLSEAALAGSVSVTRFKHYVLNDVTQDIEPESVEFTVDEKEHTILIQVPDWLRYNPQSVPQPELPPPVEAVVDLHRGRRRHTR